jgi:hypothetical protein
MNREDLIRMAREAAAQHGHTIKPTDEIVETLTSFALIVEYEASKKAHERGYQLGLEIGAAAEREACADACDQQANAWQQAAWSHSAIEAHAIRQCAAAIRSRKENT